MKNFRKNVLKSRNGITLIALVITVIVLLILAGISISMLSGNNGILKKSTDAKTNTDNAQIKERIQLAYTAAIANGLGNDDTFDNELKKEFGEGNYTLSSDENNWIVSTGVVENYEILKSGTTGGGSGGGTGDYDLGTNGKPLVNKDNIPETSHEKIIGEDANGNQVVVPDGFKVADDSGTTVKDGIVIEDNEGNQYVWIPVSNINHDGSNKIKVNSSSEEGVEITLGRYTFDTSSPGNPTLAANSYQYADSYATPVALASTLTGTSKYYQELKDYRQSNYSSGTDGTNTTARGVMESGSYNGIRGFIDSVAANKGYYIARYEASYRANGKAGSIQSTSSTDTLALTSAPATRTAGNLWNFIKQGEAATACYDLYTTINSDLMNSYAWDTAIVYIQAMGNTNYANANRGSHIRLMNTGTTRDEKCKIYDMAGNEYEWTTEYSSETSSSGAYACVEVGGCYGNSQSYTRCHCGNYATFTSQGFSFRPTLYL